MQGLVWFRDRGPSHPVLRYRGTADRVQFGHTTSVASLRYSYTSVPCNSQGEESCRKTRRPPPRTGRPAACVGRSPRPVTGPAPSAQERRPWRTARSPSSPGPLRSVPRESCVPALPSGPGDANTPVGLYQGNFGCRFSNFGLANRNRQRGKGFDNFGACVLEGRDGH
jgi:hypothetical protein